MVDDSRNRTLESLKNEARRWLKQLRAGDPPARQRFERALPGFHGTPSLRHLQHALARENGYAGWTALKQALRRAPRERSLAHYEAAAQALLEAYRTGSRTALERHYSFTWHRRAWQSMRTYVQLDLGKRPEHPGADVEIAIEDAQYLIAIEHGFASWDELRRYSETASPAALATARPVHVASQGRGPHSSQSARDWDIVLSLLQQTPSPELYANGQMTDAALARVAAVEDLRRLTVAGSRAVTDKGIAHLAGLPRLEALDLSGTSITDSGLHFLAHLPALRSLSLAGTRITDAGAAALAKCPLLEKVDLSWTETGDEAIRALVGMAHLRDVSSGVHVTDAGLPLLHDLPHFKAWHGRPDRLCLIGERTLPNTLSLRGSFTDAGLSTLRGLEGLFALDLDDGSLPITAAGLKPLVELPRLALLAVDAKDDWMSVIAAMPALRALQAQDTAAGDDGFVALSRSGSLEYLWGRRCHRLQRRGFAALAKIPTLIGLSVSCLNVDDEGVAALPSFPSLRELMPMDVPDEGYRHVAKCEKLDSLILMYCRDTTDRATESIGGMRLRYYFNSYTTITDRTPEILSRMDSLERITFDGCHGLTDAGVAALARLPRLRELRVAGRGVTPAVAQPFPARVKVFYGG